MECVKLEKLERPGKQELKLEFIQLRAKGYSFSKIAKKLKVSKTTLANWNQELEQEIASAKAMELEALFESFYLLKEGRVKLLGGLVKKLQKEAESRDLSDLPTDKLLDLLLKYHAALKEEYVESRPLSDQEIASLKALKAESGMKLDNEQLGVELEALLQRYRAGLLTIEQAKQELYLLLAMLKAQEQAVLEDKLDHLEEALGARR